MSNMMRNENDLLEKSFGDILQPTPIIFVKNTMNHKKLREEDANNPLKIFSNFDKMLDKFFNLDDAMNNSIHSNSNLNNNLALPSKIDEEAKPKHKIVNNSGKLINILPADKDDKSETEETKLFNENIKDFRTTEIIDKKNKTSEDGIIRQPILNKEGFSVFHIIKYSIYFILFLTVFCCAKLIFDKIVQRETELMKDNLISNNNHHSINQLEEELRGMKDKNKLF
jgi:hypothetical protein